MQADTPRDLFACFDDLEDPRMNRTRQHRLDDVIALAMLATVCGAQGWTDIEHFGLAKRDWLNTFSHLPNTWTTTTPSHDTFGRVFAMLDPDAFEQCFFDWVRSLVDVSGQEALHIDGKTVRRSFDTASDKTALHVVSVWASEAELALGRTGRHRRQEQ